MILGVNCWGRKKVFETGVGVREVGSQGGRDWEMKWVNIHGNKVILEIKRSDKRIMIIRIKNNNDNNDNRFDLENPN